MRAATLLLLLVACGAPPTKGSAPVAPVTPEPAKSVETPPPPPPVASAAPDPSKLAPLPSSLRCDGSSLGPPIKHPAAASRGTPPTAGQMSEAAAQAKRLFDGEKWEEALKAHESITSGASKDDDGNRQIAQYRRAIILYRLKRTKESYTAFATIAKDASHLKHGETFLWLAKIAMSEPELIQLADISAYAPADVARFHNATQKEVYEVLSYLLGRERAQEGATADARALLGAVPEGHPYAASAKQCSALLH